MINIILGIVNASCWIDLPLSNIQPNQLEIVLHLIKVKTLFEIILMVLNSDSW